MKVIDKEGKLFGLINILDLIIVLVLIFAVVFGAKRYFTKPDESQMMQDAKLTFEVGDVRDLTVQMLHKGDMLYWADRTRPIGKIVDIESTPTEKPLEIDGEWVNKVVPGKYDVKFTIEATLKDDGDAYWATGEQVRVGIKYIVKTKYMNMEAYLVKLDVYEK